MFDIYLTGTEAVMSRVQLALNVDNLDEEVVPVFVEFEVAVPHLRPAGW